MVTAANEIFVERLHVIIFVLRVNHYMAEFTFLIIFVSSECVFLFLLLRPEDLIALDMRVLVIAVEKLTWMESFHVQQQHPLALQNTTTQKTLGGFSCIFAQMLVDLVFFGFRDFSLSILAIPCSRVNRHIRLRFFIVANCLAAGANFVSDRAELHPALFDFFVWNTQIL